MPTLHRLPHCKIDMRTRDHRPAHVHVLFSDGREALVYLSDLKVDTRGRILAKELAAALEWIGQRAAKLAIDFEELQQ
jgi:hypothetical protein